MLLIGIVALIVVGPKDLPGLFRTIGQFVGKAKGMAREFSSAMNAAADEAGVSEINKTIKAAANPQKFGVDKIREASQERAANKEKIDKAMAQAAETRIAAEKAQAAEAAKPPAKAAAKKAAPKRAAKKAPAKAKATATAKAAAKPAAKPKAKAAPKPKAAAKDKT
ncbi:UNVERIFIED_CONTAM: hypothetical protein GTU68_058663 [Idotea baltica]|nr:hypothetical protein [Idotea baltica]